MKYKRTPEYDYKPMLIDRVSRMIANGVSLSEISKRVGLSYKTLCNWEERGEIRIKNARKVYVRRGDLFYRRLYARYTSDTDMTVVQLARIYGIKPTTISSAWQRLGLKVDNQRRYKIAMATREKTQRARLSVDELAATWTDYKAGRITLNDTAAALHVRPQTLKRRWREMGYPVDKTVAQFSNVKKERV